MSSKSLLAMFVVSIAAAFTAISGNGPRLPLDAHEIFVARTAEEMFARDSFVVPFNNDEPRVKKPPLAYWLVMGVDWANDHDYLISEWEARVPSIASGILLTVLICALGISLFGLKTGLISGLMIASSGGYVQYTHSARPEMLYAACCAAAMLGFARALLSHSLVGALEGHRQPVLDTSVWKLTSRAMSISGGMEDLGHRYRIAAWVGWLMLGLAVLAKGPQLPLLIVIGVYIFAIREHGWKIALTLLRPWTGLLIMLAVSAWWFVIVRLRVPQSGATWTGETISRWINSDGDPLTQFLNPYYLYRTAGLIVPWVVLYPLALIAPIFPFMKKHQGAKLLWWMFTVPLVLLHVSLGRRWYYMLPVMGPMAVLIAWGAVQCGRQLIADGRAFIWRLTWIGHVIALILAMAWLWQSSPTELRPPAWAPWTVLSSAVIGLILIVRNPLSSTRLMARDLMTVFGFGVIFCVCAAAHASIWRIDRLDDRQFSREVGRIVSEQDLLLGWQTDWETVQYYNHRAIPSPMDTAALKTLLRESFASLESQPDRRVFLLEASEKPVKLPRQFHSEEVFHLRASTSGPTLYLLRITPAEPSAGHLADPDSE